jgi:hypothetical protein
MRSSAKRAESPLPTVRPAYRTLEGWTLGLFLEHGAIKECEEHGHIRDRTDPDAWKRAREAARLSPFPGTSAQEAVAALDKVMMSIGDTCPECD